MVKGYNEHWDMTNIENVYSFWGSNAVLELTFNIDDEVEREKRWEIRITASSVYSDIHAYIRKRVNIGAAFLSETPRRETFQAFNYS